MKRETFWVGLGCMAADHGVWVWWSWRRIGRRGRSEEREEGGAHEVRYRSARVQVIGDIVLPQPVHLIRVKRERTSISLVLSLTQSVKPQPATPQDKGRQ
jgi:hypothetical protein